MDSGRLETFIIAMLICVDLFFFCTFEAYELKNNTISDEIVEGTCDILSGRGILANPDVVYRSLEDYYVLSFVNSDDALKAASSCFVCDDSAEFAIPGGKAFFTDRVYFQAMENTEFIYRDLEEFPMPLEDPEDVRAEDTAEYVSSYARKLIDGEGELISLLEVYEAKNALKSVFCTDNTDSDMSDIVFKYKSEDRGYIYYVGEQTREGLTVRDNTVVVCVRDGKTVYITGRYIFANSTERHDVEFYDGANILFFLPRDCGAVSEMRLMYRKVFYSENSFYLVPTYDVAFEDKNIIIDAVSGTIR